MSCVHKGGTGPVRGFNSSEQEKSSKLYPGNGAKPGAKDALVGQSTFLAFSLLSLFERENPS